MSKYMCMDCKETSEKVFEGGVCSNCKSLNIRNTGRRFHKKDKKEPIINSSTFLMIILWGFIIYEIYIGF